MIKSLKLNDAAIQSAQFTAAGIWWKDFIGFGWNSEATVFFAVISQDLLFFPPVVSK